MRTTAALAPRGPGLAAAAMIGAWSTAATAHDVPVHDPADMPHHVAAAYIAMDAGRYDGPIATTRLGGDGGLFTAGARVAYGYAVHRPVELRLGVQYDKPFIGVTVVDERLHALRATLGAVYAEPLAGPDLELTVAVDAGGAWFLLEPADTASSAEQGVEVAHGWTASASLGARSWISGHVATFVEVSAGLTATDGAALSITKAWPWRLSFGLMDRF